MTPPTAMTPMAPEANDAWPQVGRPAPSGTQEVLFEEEFAQRGGDPAQRRGAANDDRRSVGQLLQSLQQRPSRGPYVIAAICALVWTGLGVIIAMNYYGGDIRAVGSQGGPGAAQLFGLAAAILVPSMFFFVLAHMVARAQELRTISRSMTEVAMRLAEPETIASDSIVSRSARRSAAKSRPWATAWSARSRALPNSNRSCITKSRRSSAPITTTSCASAA